MSSITIKKLPERLHLDYKRRARANHRSLQAEIIRTLEEAIGLQNVSDPLPVDSVAGMLNPKRKGISVEAMHAAVDEELKSRWQRS